jgi:hypothetical protein
MQISDRAVVDATSSAGAARRLFERATMLLDGALGGKPLALWVRLGDALEVAALWAAVMALGIFGLGLLVQAALSAQVRAAELAQREVVLQKLAARVEVDIAAGASFGRTSEVQRHLEEALAQSPALGAIDLVATDGQVLMSTEASAVGGPAAASHSAAEAVGAVVTDASGLPVGRIVALGSAPPRDALSPARGALRWSLAMSIAALLGIALWPGNPAQPPELAQARARLRSARARLASVATEIRENRSEKTAALQ